METFYYYNVYYKREEKRFDLLKAPKLVGLKTLNEERNSSEFKRRNDFERSVINLSHNTTNFASLLCSLFHYVFVFKVTHILQNIFMNIFTHGHGASIL